MTIIHHVERGKQKEEAEAACFVSQVSDMRCGSNTTMTLGSEFQLKKQNRKQQQQMNQPKMFLQKASL